MILVIHHRGPLGRFRSLGAQGRNRGTDSRNKRIATAARKLLRKRNAWLKPPRISEEELKKRTLTKLYNENPTWLKDAHRELDEAAFAACGWAKDLWDEEMLGRLLHLNMARIAEETLDAPLGSRAGPDFLRVLETVEFGTPTTRMAGSEIPAALCLRVGENAPRVDSSDAQSVAGRSGGYKDSGTQDRF
jgi:hypothetical protein